MILFVTVVFNDLQGLNDTIKSLEQAHHLGISFKHIIIDGQSTDGTKEFIECLKVPYELVWVSEDDHGIYDAMNKGLDRCSHGYVNFLNAGDVLCFDKFDWSRFTMDLKTSGFDIIACGYIFKDIKSKTKYVAPRRITCMYPGMPSSHQAMFFQSKAIKSTRFDINFRVCGDFDFIMRMIYNGATISLFDGPVVVFRSGGLSFQKPTVLFRESMRVSANYCTSKLILPLKVLQLSLSLVILHIRRWI
jgi:putative colanic acid biosynthesis glycosyltransferase